MVALPQNGTTTVNFRVSLGSLNRILEFGRIIVRSLVGLGTNDDLQILTLRSFNFRVSLGSLNRILEFIPRIYLRFLVGLGGTMTCKFTILYLNCYKILYIFFLWTVQTSFVNFNYKTATRLVDKKNKTTNK